MFCFLWSCCVTPEKVHSWQLNLWFANYALYCDPRSLSCPIWILDLRICLCIHHKTTLLLCSITHNHFFLSLHLYNTLRSATSAGLYEQDSGMPDTSSYLCCCNSYGPDPNPLEVFGKASIYLSDLCMKSQETFASFLEENCQIMGVSLGSLRDRSLKRMVSKLFGSCTPSAKNFEHAPPVYI